MTVERAIRRRILELCMEKKFSVSKLADVSGINRSTVYEFLAGRTKCPTVTVVKQLCEGAGVSLRDFFDKEYF